MTSLFIELGPCAVPIDQIFSITPVINDDGPNTSKVELNITMHNDLSPRVRTVFSPKSVGYLVTEINALVKATIHQPPDRPYTGPR